VSECAAQYFTTGIDRDHIRVPDDERSRGDPGSGTHVEHLQSVDRTERVEHLVGIRRATDVVLVDGCFE
jgi:hypothetical protein